MTNKWDRRFMDMAQLVGNWNKNEGTKVGAVITNKDNRVISVGFNGFPRGVNDSIVSREVKLLRTIHAEENAIMFAKSSIERATIYVNYHPCCSCMAKIIQSGINRVVYQWGSGLDESWIPSQIQARQLARESGIILDHI